MLNVGVGKVRFIAVEVHEFGSSFGWFQLHAVNMVRFNWIRPCAGYVEFLVGFRGDFILFRNS